MKAQLQDRRTVADGTIEVVFRLKDEEASFVPGQHILVVLLNSPYTDEKGSLRIFLVQNITEEWGIIRIATRISESAFKKLLNEMPI